MKLRELAKMVNDEMAAGHGEADVELIPDGCPVEEVCLTIVSLPDEEGCRAWYRPEPGRSGNTQEDLDDWYPHGVFAIVYEGGDDE